MSFWRDLQDSNPGEIPESRGAAIQVVVPQRNAQASVDSAFDELQAEEAGVAEEIQEGERVRTEVARRVRKADCYMAIIDGAIFDGSASEEALEVEAEFRTFALKRLGQLMGIEGEDRPTPVAKQFSDDEERILKTWAAKLLGKPSFLGVEPAPSATPPAPTRVEPTIKAPVVAMRPAPTQVPMGPPPAVRTVVDPVRRLRGRPVGSKNKPREAPVPTATPAAGNMEVERIGADGEVKKVTLNLQKPATPAPGGVQRLPMPSQEAALMLEAGRAEQMEAKSEVLNRLKASKE